MKKFFRNNISGVMGYVLGGIVIFPILWLALSSFKSNSEITNTPFSLPQRFEFHNFVFLFKMPGFLSSLANSLVIALLTTIVTAIIAIPSSYIFSRYDFPGKGPMKTFALVGAYLFAPAILAFPYFKLLAEIGLVNSITGILLAHLGFCLPFSLSVGDLIFRSVPRQLEEVAILDKVSPFRRLYKLIIPSAFPQVLALLLLVFAISWKEFFFAFVISSDASSRTLPVWLANMYGGESLNWDIICALSTIMILPSVIMLLFGRRIKVISLLTPGTRG